jgi:hypothetical protein
MAVYMPVFIPAVSLSTVGRLPLFASVGLMHNLPSVCPDNSTRVHDSHGSACDLMGVII